MSGHFERILQPPGGGAAARDGVTRHFCCRLSGKRRGCEDLAEAASGQPGEGGVGEGVYGSRRQVPFRLQISSPAWSLCHASGLKMESSQERLEVRFTGGAKMSRPNSTDDWSKNKKKDFLFAHSQQLMACQREREKKNNKKTGKRLCVRVCVNGVVSSCYGRHFNEGTHSPSRVHSYKDTTSSSLFDDDSAKELRVGEESGQCICVCGWG